MKKPSALIQKVRRCFDFKDLQTIFIFLRRDTTSLVNILANSRIGKN
jgi:hypothetical protein